MPKLSHLRLFMVGIAFLLPACAGSGQLQPVAVEVPPAQEAAETPIVEEVETVAEDVVVEEPDAATAEPEQVEEVAVAENSQVEPAVEITGPKTGRVATATEAPPMEQVEAVEPPPVEAERELIVTEPAVARPGPTLEQRQLLASLSVKGQPPELFNRVWLNSEPLKLADLRGKVVIVEFWTFG